MVAAPVASAAGIEAIGINGHTHFFLPTERIHMRAFLFLKHPEDHAVALAVLRERGCDEIVTDPDHIGTGEFQYAVLQVFDETVDHLRYDMTPDHPRMVQLAEFVRSHPECYVLAITHRPCENDGSLSHAIGADYWLTDGFMGLIGSHLDYAREFHRTVKGIPAWDAKQGVATTASQPAASL